MLLATRCPFCETVFRIQPQQLAVRHGLVRCGHCQETFDASGSLFEMPAGGDFSQAVPVAPGVAAGLTSAAAAAPNFPNPSRDAGAPDQRATPQAQPGPAEPRLTPDAPAAPSAARWKSAEAGEPAATAVPTARPAPRWKSAEAEPAEPTLSSGGVPNSSADAAEPHLSAQPADGPRPFADLPPSDGTPFAMTREAPARAPRRTGWRIVGVLVALLLLALLAAQLAWWLRETVMVYWPQSVPLYQQACAKIGCRVLPPRDIDGLQVEPSDLRQVDDPHHLELKMPLRNRFDVALAYPAIELTLLDRQNNAVLRRVLWPQDYVPPGTRIDAGLAARTTQTMVVRLDTGDVVASNFRIEVFYP